MTSAPWTFGEAVRRNDDAAELQEAAEDALVKAAEEAATAEQKYRVALAVEIVRQHDVEGLAWSVCDDVARGQTHVAELRQLRDIAEGKREAMVHSAWRHAHNRKAVDRFADWSMRRELAEGYGDQREPDGDIIGGRR